MGQKHNRRRNRPRSRRRRNPNLRPLPIHPDQANNPFSIWATGSYSQLLQPATSAVPMQALPAQHWQNGYAACGPRGSLPDNSMTQLEQDQCRLFGGEPGDDVALCYRMLEYFGGLDYIDT